MDNQKSTDKEISNIANKLPTVTSGGNVRCRFDLFVVLNVKEQSRFTGGVRQWCYRGDKYTEDESKMLINLLKMVKKDIENEHKYYHLEIWDNNYYKGTNERIIFRYFRGKIEKNILFLKYVEMIGGIAWPDFIKESVLT